VSRHHDRSPLARIVTRIDRPAAGDRVGSSALALRIARRGTERGVLRQTAATAMRSPAEIR